MIKSDSAKYWAIVPAAGMGTRMQADRPKQYLPLYDGRSVIEHTLSRLAEVEQIQAIVVCLANDDRYWTAPDLSVPLYIASGGKERIDSVLNGLQRLAEHADDQDWVLVHDAARPCVDPADINTLIQTVGNHAVGGILASRVYDTMKWCDGGGNDDDTTISHTVARENLWRALTPQLFRCGALRQALQKALENQCSITDEASAMEHSGLMPLLVAGRADNIKLTHADDLDRVNWLLSR